MPALADRTDILQANIPAAHTASLLGRVIDARNYRAVDFQQQCGVVSGSSPTWDGKVQESPPPADMSEIQQVTEGSTDIILREGATTNVLLALSFTVGAAAQTVRSVKIPLKKLGTVASGKVVYVTIEGDSTGDPDGTPVQTSRQVQTDDISADYAFVEFVFDDPIDLTAATAYHVVLQGDYTESATDAIAWRSNTVASGGNMEHNNGTVWADTATEDLEVQGTELVFTDVSGATFTQITASNPDAETVQVDRKTAEAYLRYHGTIGGTSTPTFNLSVIAVGGEKKVLD